MSITLYSNIEGVTLTLPSELIWQDEFTWNDVKSQGFYSIVGDFIIQNNATDKGRPVTLAGDNAAIKRNDLLTLTEWANILNHTMVLSIHDRTFDVIFRHWDGALEQSTPFGGYSNPTDGNYYLLTVRLVTI
jgi:hypothetical protein